MANARTGKSLTKFNPEAGLTKAQKAAIVLASLNAETASTIVDDISDTQLRTFAKSFSELKAVPPQLLQSIVTEFLSEVQGPTASTELAGGLDEARRVLGELAEKERVDRILADLGGGSSGAVWTRVEEIDDKIIAEYAQAERMPVAATIFSKLSMEKAANVLTYADEDFSKDLLLVMARKTPPPAEVVDEIAYAMEEDLLKQKASSSTSAAANAGAFVGEIINFLPAEKRDSMLQHLQETDKEVGAEARKSVVTFEELYQRLPPDSVPALLREVDDEVLLSAVRYGEANAQETVDFFLSNIAKRMAEQYREQLSEMDQVKQLEGENAQRNFNRTLRQMMRKGDIELIPLPSPEEDEEKEE